MNEKRDYLLELVANWLESHGYREAQAEHGDVPKVMVDGVFKKPRAAAILLEAKVADVYRSQVFPAMVGDAILRHGTLADNEELLLAFLLKRVSERAEADMREYAERFRPNLNWLVIDEAGRGFARLHGGSEKVKLQPLIPNGRSRYSIRKGGMFSANNQWLLKFLLLHKLDPKFWGGPRVTPESITDLSRIAKVPQPTVSKFVARFEDAGYLQRTGHGFRIRRHVELMDDWFHADKQGSREAVGVRSMYGEEPENAFLDRLRQYDGIRVAAGQGPRVAVSHHLACHLLGVGHSNVRALLIRAHVPMESLLSDLDLVRDESNDSSMAFRFAQSQNPVFGGVVISNGVPVCDLLQCYLDVRHSRARGEEQARYILDRILMPHFKENS